MEIFKDDIDMAKLNEYYVARASVAEPEPHHLAGAVTRCGSGSDGSGSDNGIYHG
jgi:hypothetical protein